MDDLDKKLAAMTCMWVAGESLTEHDDRTCREIRELIDEQVVAAWLEEAEIAHDRWWVEHIYRLGDLATVPHVCNPKMDNPWCQRLAELRAAAEREKGTNESHPQS